MIDEKHEVPNEDYYIKENGKKVKLKFNLNAIVTDKLFEIPSHLFTFADPQFQPKTTKSKHAKSELKQEETAPLALTK